MKTVIACYLSCHKTHEVSNFKEGQVYFVPKFQRPQSVSTQPYCVGPVIRQNWEVEMEQSCSLHGIKEAKGLPATLLYLGEIPDRI